MAELTDTDAREEAAPSSTGQLRETRDSLKAVFRNPNLRRVQLAFFGSSIGDFAYATALMVWAYDVGGAKAVGLYIGIRCLLGALTAPIGATFADRWPRRRVMILADLLRAVLVAAAAVLIALDTATLVVFALAMLTALLSSPFLVAQRALLPSLSKSPRDLTAANAVHSTIDSLGFFVGPALAAPLLIWTNVPVVLALNVVTFLWSMALVSRVTTATTTPEPSEGEDGYEEDAAGDDQPSSPGFVEETLAGFKLIRRDRDLTLATLGVSLQSTLMGASMVFLVVIAAELLRAGPEGLGYLNAVLGVGAVVGGLVAISRSAKGTIGRDFSVGVVLSSAPLLLISGLPLPAACFVAVGVIGIANSLVDINLDSLFQRVTPDAMLGRVFGALESCLIATASLGAFLMPFLLDWLGLRLALAVITVPVVVLSLVQMPAMLRLDARLTRPRGLDLLRRIDIFSPLPPGTLEALSRALEEARFGAGEVILREGADSDLFYVIESGRVQVSQGDRALREQGPGEYFGEIGLLRDVPRTATITATENTVLRTLSREDFLRAITGHRESKRAAEGVVRRRLAV